MLSKQKIFYVYALMDPRVPGPFTYGRWKFDYEPFYIGKGKNNRVFGHFKSLSANTPKNNKIKKIFSSGLEPVTVLKRSSLTEKQAFALEYQLISLIGRKGSGPLTNLTDGGEGLSNPSTSTRSKLSKAATLYNKSLSSTDLKKRSKLISEKTRLGKKNMSDAKKQKHIKALSKATKSYWDSLDTEEKLARMSAIVAKREQNMTRADKKARSSRMSAHMKKVTQARESDPDKKRSHYRKVSKAMCQAVSIDGKKYESSKHAASKLGLSQATISNRLNSDKFPTYFKL